MSRPPYRRFTFPVLLILAAATAHAQSLPHDFAALSDRAAAARDANDPAAAIALYKQALQINPNWPEGWWMAGSLQYDTAAYAAGAESLAHLVKMSPQAGPAWALLGLCNYETGDYPSALDQIQRSLQLGLGNQPQMTLVLKFHEAALLARMGRFDEAMRKYTSFIPGQVTDEQVLAGLALAHLRVPATPSEIAPGKKDLFLSVGRALSAFLTGNMAAAQPAYQNLITRFPNDANAHYAYGYFLLGSDPNRAIEEWQRTLVIDNSYAGAHSMLAWTFWLRDEKPLALDHAAKALEKDPALTVARIVFGRLTVESGRIQPGIENLEHVVHDDPSNLEAHLALATAFSEAGRKADSQRERQICLTLQSGAAAAQP